MAAINQGHNIGLKSGGTSSEEKEHGNRKGYPRGVGSVISSASEAPADNSFSVI